MNETYQQALAFCQSSTRENGIDAALNHNGIRLDALLVPPDVGQTYQIAAQAGMRPTLLTRESMHAKSRLAQVIQWSRYQQASARRLGCRSGLPWWIQHGRSQRLFGTRPRSRICNSRWRPRIDEHCRIGIVIGRGIYPFWIYKVVYQSNCSWMAESLVATRTYKNIHEQFFFCLLKSCIEFIWCYYPPKKLTSQRGPSPNPFLVYTTLTWGYCSG